MQPKYFVFSCRIQYSYEIKSISIHIYFLQTGFGVQKPQNPGKILGHPVQLYVESDNVTKRRKKKGAARDLSYCSPITMDPTSPQPTTRKHVTFDNSPSFSTPPPGQGSPPNQTSESESDDFPSPNTVRARHEIFTTDPFEEFPLCNIDE